MRGRQWRWKDFDNIPFYWKTTFRPLSWRTFPEYFLTFSDCHVLDYSLLCRGVGGGCFVSLVSPDWMIDRTFRGTIGKEFINTNILGCEIFVLAKCLSPFLYAFYRHLVWQKLIRVFPLFSYLCRGFGKQGFQCQGMNWIKLLSRPSTCCRLGLQTIIQQIKFINRPIMVIAPWAV